MKPIFLDLNVQRAMLITGQTFLIAAFVMYVFDNILLTQVLLVLGAMFLLVMARQTLRAAELMKTLLSSLWQENEPIKETSHPVHMLIHAPEFTITRNSMITPDQAERVLEIIDEGRPVIRD